LRRHQKLSVFISQLPPVQPVRVIAQLLQLNAKLSNGQNLSIYVPAKASRRAAKSPPRRAAAQRGKAPAKAAARADKATNKR
jgi:hypothetical protein